MKGKVKDLKVGSKLFMAFAVIVLLYIVTGNGGEDTGG